MLFVKPYRRENAVAYARRWAFGQNPLFGSFAGFGGNCTNFVSQCIFAGSCVMNRLPIFGWYYNTMDDRAPAWSGVTFFYRFMTENEGIGPFGKEISATDAELGDVIQLGREDTGYYHSLLIVGFEEEDPLVAAQTDDALDRPLSTYTYDYARFLHIEGVRFTLSHLGDCFEDVLEGVSLPRRN